MSEKEPTPSSVEESVTSTNIRREAREKRVQTVLKFLKMLGLPVSVTGVTGTIILLQNGQYKLAVITIVISVLALVIAIWGNFFLRVINRTLDLIEEELENIEEPIAQWIVKQFKTIPVRLWWQFNLKFKDRYYESLIDTFRELKIEGFRIGLPALDLEDIFVSLRVKTGTPDKIRGRIITRQSDNEQREIWEFLKNNQGKFRAYRRLAVIASPGSGKTTLLKHLTLTYAKKQHNKYQAPNFIPVLLYLRDIRHQLVTENPPSLSQLIREHIENLPSEPPLTLPPNWIEDQLRLGKCLVMLDGLDEVANAHERNAVSAWVNQQMKVYRQTVFIVTSRPHGFQSAPIERVGTVLEVLPFNPQQVEDFIRSLYQQNEIMRTGRETPAVLREAETLSDDLITRIQEKPAIADMARNPLLVTMIATVHYCGSALPGRRVELYQKICDLLLGARQQAKKIKVPLTGEQNKSVLQVLALSLMQAKTREFSLELGTEIIQEELGKVAGNTLTGKEFLKQIKEISGLLVEKELKTYEFAHLSFQEYLAASEIKELQQESILIDNFQDPWWAETIRLYAAQTNATSLIQAGIKTPTVHSLVLALDCKEERLKVDPEIREQLDTILEQGLESNNPEIATLAAQVKLSRRLSNLTTMDDNLYIDSFYITCAEYQLFMDDDDLFYSGEHFAPGSAKQPITEVSWLNGMRFCLWLTAKAPSLTRKSASESTVFFFRLPTLEEVQNYHPREHEDLGCLTLEETGDSHQQNQGIRLVKTPIRPSLYGVETFSFNGFEGVTANAQGQESQRRREIYWYFTENLGKEVDLELVYIPGGAFTMGSPETEKGSLNRERPQHQVTVSPFFMGKYPVTQAQWRAIASRTDLKVEIDLKPNPSYFKGDERPVETVYWYEAVEFCQRLSKLTGRDYRLPSEAEWEYACRAVRKPLNLEQGESYPPFHFGDTITDQLANYSASNTYANEPKGKDRRETTPVGQFPPNAFGLYDMHGNVWEWCLDPWHDDYNGAPSDGSVWGGQNRTNNSTSVHRLFVNNIQKQLTKERYYAGRGGSFNNGPRYCRSASRDYDGACVNVLGFRVVCVLPRTGNQ